MRMRGTVQFFSLSFGLVLHVFDLGSDIYVAYQYYRTEQWWWFGLTLTFVIVPIVVINVAASLQSEFFSSGENDQQHQGLCWDILCLLTFCSCSSIIIRYIEEFQQWKAQNRENSPCEQNCRRMSNVSNCQRCESYLQQKTRSAKSAYRLAWLNHIETVTESAPQWCLQVYIMLRQWYFPWYTIFSAGLSLVSLAWSVTYLEKARQKKNGNSNFKYCSTFVFLLWQLAALISRLSAIVFCAYVTRLYVFVSAIAHWFLAALCYDLWFGDRFTWKDLFDFLLVNYPLFFNVSEPLLRNDKDWKPAITKMNISLAFQNMLMLVISNTISEPGVPRHIEEVRPFAISFVVGGLITGILFCLAYFKLYRTIRIHPLIVNVAPAADPSENRNV